MDAKQKCGCKQGQSSSQGGVGKSTVAANMAISLSLAGRHVGLLDVDIHGPSIPKMLHLEDAVVQTKDGAMLPVEHAGLKVMSIGFLLRDRDDAVIWRSRARSQRTKHEPQTTKERTHP
jgi:ATP-binding protein involved in chromosome partitioning